MRKKHRRYLVKIRGISVSLLAKSAGNAFRLAVRAFMAYGNRLVPPMKRQPKSTPDGGWENTSVTLIRE